MRFGAILIDLDAQERQKGGQKEPKRHQKQAQNDIKIWTDFWIDFGSIWGAQAFV